MNATKIASIVLLVCATMLDAQEVPAPGATVRVWSSELARQGRTASLVAWRTDSIAIVPRGRSESFVVSRGSVRRVDVLTRRTRGEGARTYALVGLLQGALTGAALGALASALGGEYYPNGTDKPSVHWALIDVPIGAALGAGIGAIAGSRWPGSRWRRMSVLP